jgi:hypothetical protein
MIRSEKHIPGTFPCMPEPHNWLFWLALCISATVFGLSYYYGNLPWYWTVAICVPILFIGCSITCRRIILPQENSVEERELLFDRFLISKRIKPLADFVQVFCELMYADDNNFWVGLKHKTGRVLWVKRCGCERRFAEELAWRIHCDTGVGLKGEQL